MARSKNPKPKPKPRQKPTTIQDLVCPHCGAMASQGGKFRFVEAIDCYRQVKGLKNGELVVDAIYETGEGYDDGRDQRWECRNKMSGGRFCGHRWPVERWMLDLIEWV